MVARSGELTRPGRDVGTGADGSSGEPITLLDPTEREELVMQGSVVAVLNQHQELCALHKPGGLPVTTAPLLDSVRAAAAAVPRFREAVEGALAQHAVVLEARAAALAKTGRVQKEAPAHGGVSVPTAALAPPAPTADAAPLTAATHFPATRLDGAKLGLDGRAAPRGGAADGAAADGAAFQGGASAWEADGTAPAAPAVAAPAVVAEAPLDSDEEEATVTLTSTLGGAQTGAPPVGVPAPKKGKKRKAKA